MTEALLERLRRTDVASEVGPLAKPLDQARLEEWQQSGVRFVSSAPRLTERYYQAVRELFDCIAPLPGVGDILHEGGIYHGCWLESTGTINAEVLGRFLPSVATSTFSAFRHHQRADGLFPYKITPDGPAFNQIQLVSPLARAVHDHFRLHGLAPSWLAGMAEAMARYDGWLATHRDTLGTGGVEAFSTYDTGHDLSSRFWHVPDSPFGNDPARYDPQNPILPFIAPDLTANVACQRHYLGLIAELLGEDGKAWFDAAAAIRSALFAQCFDAADHFFYDRDRHGRLVRVQSDVLLRVLACEIGDADLLRVALERHLLNTRKFFARFPLTSMALDDPRFDRDFAQNSWAGPTNFLTLLRAPRAFEYHGHHTELTWIMQPVLAALVAADRFPQTLNPFTGAPGFTEKYAPAILTWLDFIERLAGILPRPDGDVWFTSVLPRPVLHRQETWDTGYSRIVDGVTFDMLNTAAGGAIYRDGELICRFPAGLRAVLDRAGNLRSVIAVASRPVEGSVWYGGRSWDISVPPNDSLSWAGDEVSPERGPGLVLPQYE